MPVASKSVLYEFPCNEKIRTFMRLEKSLQRMEFCISQDDDVSFLIAFRQLFDLIELTTRPDLRKDIIQELQRQRAVLLSDSTVHGFTAKNLQAALNEIDKVIGLMAIPNNVTKSLQSLRDHDWLNMVRARSQMPGGICSFDLPSLHHWLTRPFPQRKEQFEQWLEGTAAIKQSVSVILSLVRQTAKKEKCVTKAGSFSIPVPHQNNWQMVQITVPMDCNSVPEVSANKFMLWVHFLDVEASMKTPPSRSDIEFRLSTCGI